MKSREISVVCVGKLKTAWWREAAAHYLNALKSWREVAVRETRDSDPKLPQAERMAREADLIVKLLPPRSRVIALDEGGKLFSSTDLAAWLRRLDEGESRGLTFVVGGPFGLPPEFLARADDRISLSPLTFPHELARVLLLEQLFRAETLLRAFPYHH